MPVLTLEVEEGGIREDFEHSIPSTRAIPQRKKASKEVQYEGR